MDQDEYVARVAELPERFSTRLSREHTVGLRLLAEGADWDELVHDAIITLFRDGAILSPEEKRDLRILGQLSGLSEEVLVCLGDEL